jgi:hypothetical protein
MWGCEEREKERGGLRRGGEGRGRGGEERRREGEGVSPSELRGRDYRGRDHLLKVIDCLEKREGNGDR